MRATALGLLILCTVSAPSAAVDGGQVAEPGEADSTAAPFDDYFVVADEVFAKRGETVDLGVFVSAPDPSLVVGFIHDLTFDSEAAVATRAVTRADCTINPAIDRGIGFAFQPFGCHPSKNCSAIGVSMLGVAADAIPDRTLLYTCKISISPDARLGWHPLRVINVEGYSSSGGRLLSRGVDGGVYVSDDGQSSQSTDSGGCQVVRGSIRDLGDFWCIAALVMLAGGKCVRSRLRCYSWKLGKPNKPVQPTRACGPRG
jgi:hypothetical protein